MAEVALCADRLAERPPAAVVMEACGTAHFWGREAGVRGHRVRLLPPAHL
ncbi:MAG: hypothetical protein V3S71_04530 [Acidobacteriota bacterium]